MDQLSTLKIILYTRQSIIKSQNNFVPSSITDQVSKQFCASMHQLSSLKINQLSSFKIILHPHQSIIKFQSHFVLASITYQVSK